MRSISITRQLCHSLEQDFQGPRFEREDDVIRWNSVQQFWDLLSADTRNFACRDAMPVSASFSGCVVHFEGPYISIFKLVICSKDLRCNYQRVENILHQLKLAFLCKRVCSDNSTFKAMSHDHHSSEVIMHDLQEWNGFSCTNNSCPG